MADEQNTQDNSQSQQTTTGLPIQDTSVSQENTGDQNPTDSGMTFDFDFSQAPSNSTLDLSSMSTESDVIQDPENTNIVEENKQTEPVSDQIEPITQDFSQSTESDAIQSSEDSNVVENQLIEPISDQIEPIDAGETSSTSETVIETPVSEEIVLQNTDTENSNDVANVDTPTLESENTLSNQEFVSTGVSTSIDESSIIAPKSENVVSTLSIEEPVSLENTVQKPTLNIDMMLGGLSASVASDDLKKHIEENGTLPHDENAPQSPVLFNKMELPIIQGGKGNVIQLLMRVGVSVVVIAFVGFGGYVFFRTMYPLEVQKLSNDIIQGVSDASGTVVDENGNTSGVNVSGTVAESGGVLPIDLGTGSNDSSEAIASDGNSKSFEITQELGASLSQSTGDLLEIVKVYQSQARMLLQSARAEKNTQGYQLAVLLLRKTGELIKELENLSEIDTKEIQKKFELYDDQIAKIKTILGTPASQESQSNSGLSQPTIDGDTQTENTGETTGETTGESL